MGYTHYWTRPKTISTHEMEQIVGDYMKAGFIFPDDGDLGNMTEVLSVDDECTISGEGEVFDFPRKTSKTSEFCKTNRYAYDIAVTVFLTIAKKHLKTRMHVKTDGEQDDWQKAFDICSRMLGYEYKKFDVTDNNKLRYRFWE